MCEMHEVTVIDVCEMNEITVCFKDGLIMENMHDVPWLGPHQIGPDTTAAMAVICSQVRRLLPRLPLGAQVLSACNKEALAVAKAAGNYNTSANSK